MKTFNSLADYSWFMDHGQVYQKLPQLNGSNCYKFQKGYKYMKPSEIVKPIKVPELRGSTVVTKAKSTAIINLLDDGTWVYGSPIKTKDF